MRSQAVWTKAASWLTTRIPRPLAAESGASDGSNGQHRLGRDCWSARRGEPDRPAYRVPPTAPGSDADRRTTGRACIRGDRPARAASPGLAPVRASSSRPAQRQANHRRHILRLQGDAQLGPALDPPGKDLRPTSHSRQQGTLANAIGPDQANDLTAGQRQVDRPGWPAVASQPPLAPG